MDKIIKICQINKFFLLKEINLAPFGKNKTYRVIYNSYRYKLQTIINNSTSTLVDT